MSIKVILTGATGMVGEGVLLTCLEDEQVAGVLSISRKPSGIKHPKLKELIVPDFRQLEADDNTLAGYDACFYCAGISSLGLSEEVYTQITYDTTLHVAEVLKQLNPQLVFHFVSGGHTDSTEQGKSMWARVKGRTENALIRLFPGKSYNFRPGLMKPVKGQHQFKGYNRYIKILFPLLSLFFPSLSVAEIGRAMIRATIKGYNKSVLEVADIKALAASD